MIGAYLGALALLAMAVFAPLHAASHAGEAFHLGQAAAPGGDGDERHGAPPCEICLLCINGAFAAPAGDDGPQLAPPAAADARIAGAAVEVSLRLARRERPEPRGPPPSSV